MHLTRPLELPHRTLRRVARALVARHDRLSPAAHTVLAVAVLFVLLMLAASPDAALPRP